MHLAVWIGLHWCILDMRIIVPRCIFDKRGYWEGKISAAEGHSWGRRLKNWDAIFLCYSCHDAISKVLQAWSTPPTLNTNNSFCVFSLAPWDERIIFIFLGCKCIYTFNCLVINPVFSRIFIYFPPYCAWTLKTPNFNHRLRILWLITEGLEYIFMDRKFVRM